jgi:hypothetical protein
MADLVNSNQPGEKETGTETGNVGTSPKQESGLSIRNGVLLYKQLICPMVDYACPIWRSAVHTHVRKLQVLQSKCLDIPTNAPWYNGNRQIHKYLEVPFFADHITLTTERFDLESADMENPLVMQLSRYL